MTVHTVVPYLELLVGNGLAEGTEDEVLRYKTTPKGDEALMPEKGEMEELLRICSRSIRASPTWSLSPGSISI